MTDFTYIVKGKKYYYHNTMSNINAEVSDEYMTLLILNFEYFSTNA